MAAETATSMASWRGPLFITGLPRSGTTLVSQALSCHPAIAISPETHFYDRHFRWRRARAAVAAFLGSEDFAKFQLSADDLCVGRDDPPSQLLDQALRAFAERERKAIRGEKTPDHGFHLDRIWRDFPHARVVNVIRDASDVHLSLTQVPWNTRTPFEVALRWNHNVRLSLRLAIDRPESFMWIRYEDFLDDPSRILTELCRFFGVSYDRSMEDPASARSLVDPISEPWKRKNLGPLDRTNQGKWRSQMPAKMRCFFRLCCGPLLRTCSYEVEDSDATESLALAHLSILSDSAIACGSRCRRALWRAWGVCGR